MWTTVGRWERTASQMATAALGSGFLGLVFLTNSNLQHLYSNNTQVGTAARGGLRSHFVANRAWKLQVGLVKLLVFGFPGLKALTNILWPLAQVRSANVEANEPVANWWDEKIFHRWKPTTWRHQVEKFLFYMICKNSMGQVLRRHLWGWEGGKPIRLPHHRQWQRHHQPQHCPSGERTF